MLHFRNIMVGLFVGEANGEVVGLFVGETDGEVVRL